MQRENATYVDRQCVAFTELVELIEFTRATFLQHVSKAKAAKLVRTLIDLFLDMEAGSGKEVSTYLTATAQYTCTSFYSARNARIASAVLAMAIPSVCPSVRPSVTRRYCVKTTARSTVQFAPWDSKMCLVL